MRDLFRNTPGPGDESTGPNVPASADIAQTFEQNWEVVHRALLQYLRGDEDARKPLRATIVAMSAAEQSLVFGRIESVIEALPSPNTLSHARAAFVLAEMSCGILSDDGARLFQKAEYFADDCGAVPLQREAMLRRAALYYESDRSGADLVRAREVIKSALMLGTTIAPRDCIQFMRAYTLMGKCYLAESCGSVEKESIDIAAALESHYSRNRDEIRDILSRGAREDGDAFKAIIEAEIFVAEICSDESEPDSIRGHYESLLALISAGTPLAAWGEASVLCSYAKTLRCNCERVGDQIATPARTAAQYEQALGAIRDARILIEGEGNAFEDSCLHGKVLAEEGRILYESGDAVAARKCLCDARDKLMSLAELNDYAVCLIEEICDVIDECTEELQPNDETDSSEEGNDASEAA